MPAAAIVPLRAIALTFAVALYVTEPLPVSVVCFDSR